MIKEAKLYKIETSASDIKNTAKHPTTFDSLRAFSVLLDPYVLHYFYFYQRVTNAEAQALCFAIDNDTTWHLFAVSLAGLRHVETPPLVTGIKRFFNMKPTPYYLARALALRDVHTFKVIKRNAADFLQQFETSEVDSQRNRKYGILLYNPNQVTDEQILFNTGVNPSFDTFALNLGQRVALSEAFTGYNGGLDLKGRTGDLLYRKIDELQLAAHVGPWLKHVANDEQQVEKKRHIGNDNLVVLYYRKGCEFDPAEFKSQMIYCWIVVQEMITEEEMLELDRQGKCQFKVSIVYRKFVNLAGKRIPVAYYNGEVCEKQDFYKWLTQKILDIIYGFYDAGDLQMKMQRHRQSLIDGFLK